MGNKRHWYAISFKGFLRDEIGMQADATAYIGFVDKRITMRRVADAKDAAGVDQDAALIAVSYLGRMPRSEFANGDDSQAEGVE